MAGKQYLLTRLYSGHNIENFLDPRRHGGFGRHLVAHAYYPPGIHACFATVLSGTDSMGERWIIIWSPHVLWADKLNLQETSTSGAIPLILMLHLDGSGPKLTTFTAHWLP